ncbi:hypothetical protein BTM249_13670 [Helicobacter pylori]
MVFNQWLMMLLFNEMFYLMMRFIFLSYDVFYLYLFKALSYDAFYFAMRFIFIYLRLYSFKTLFI